ncbi:maleylpyruvate isomerase family mycothiol-dependent enzyme [Amycolatopsis sp. SID8362]|uniref:maleylpyruvate isomerase family mycothiol-dependent enzyme n=1 Tax=Amycolatopsis sp. SID8362 TaxID=2690346 RepID=UPI00136E84A4|nr:maleylpyruvate isomerase family mycothiol-dependent enzyme [Amycolatopsis sp. SID8362]NBH04393.1 maleylpyruvate isomerase family mycothiol-dependent enzyme [Amycolatopsis sp. SID8362]NED41092.1 maleylpyruvate isomerase family mycothiol-dependent enzyme [Amycolatopsis sp. SID8362]
MKTLSHDRLAVALLGEADRFGMAIAGAAPDSRVPTCPEWTLRDLTRHVGVAYHKSAAIILSRPAGYVPFEAVTIDDPPAFAGLGDWLRDGAARLVAAVTEVGPETPTSTWTPDRRAGFWTRRLTHETVVHRADAALTTGAPYDVDAELAADGIAEGLGLVSAFSRLRHPALDRTPLRGTGETLLFHSTEPDLAWLARRTPSAVEVSDEPAAADVVVEGRAADLLLALTGRLAADDPRIGVSGDAELFRHWLAHTRF